MTPSRWTDVAFWRERFDQDRNMEPPAEGNHIGPGSVFGWMEYCNSAGFPCSTAASYWVWCPSPHDTAGYLRHCYVVGCLDELLDPTSWDNPTIGYQSVEDLLTKAPPVVREELRCEPKTLLSAVRELDEAMKEKSEARCFARSTDGLRQFLDALNMVDWLKNRLTIFDTPAAAGKHVVEMLESEDADVEECLGMSNTEWQRFCAGATRDRKAGTAFAKALEGLAEV